MSSLDIDFHPRRGLEKPGMPFAQRRVRLSRSASAWKPAASLSAVRPAAAFPDAVDVYAWLCQARARPLKRQTGIAQPARRRMVFAALRG